MRRVVLLALVGLAAWVPAAEAKPRKLSLAGATHLAITHAERIGRADDAAGVAVYGCRRRTRLVVDCLADEYNAPVPGLGLTTITGALLRVRARSRYVEAYWPDEDSPVLRQRR